MLFRSGKNFRETFKDHSDLIEWYDGIPETNIQPLIQFKSGDSSGYADQIAEELKEKAKREGWVLNPQGANPGSQEFKETAE